MTIAIMQPYILPYIGYLQLMNEVDKFIFYDDVAFINRGWVNRNRILVNGKDFMLTVPLKDASQNKRIADINLSDDPKWRQKLLQTLGQSYRKAPFYKTVFPLLEKIVNLEVRTIAELVRESFPLLNDYIGIQTELVPSSDQYNNSELRGQERILDICLQEKATRYINPIGGMELYDRQRFADAGIELFFIQSKRVEYPQFQNEFIPWLSIADVLMFNDVPAVQEMLKEFELI
ncbi:WbqC family protein [Larkinella humicola]|uniref:WbqC family protein n=1 Tax=Larkinella humicola TaxID=2607654 RepID=A0A5N1JNQ2_9BACT|nr:WbqC family protein [Larkinella humicola]KAA9357468.1 WbqC family protein [Larkinella humicola]